MKNSYFQISCMCFFIIYKSSLNLILVPYLFYLSVSWVHLSFTDRKICFTTLISIWKTMMKSLMQKFHHPFWWKPCLKLWSRYYQKNVSRETFSFIHYLPSNTADNQQRCDSSTLSILSLVTHTILQMRHQILCTFDGHFLYMSIWNWICFLFHLFSAFHFRHFCYEWIQFLIIESYSIVSRETLSACVISLNERNMGYTFHTQSFTKCFTWNIILHSYSWLLSCIQWNFRENDNTIHAAILDIIECFSLLANHWLPSSKK